MSCQAPSHLASGLSSLCLNSHLIGIIWLTGTIPSELTNATQLRILQVHQNIITGDPMTTITKLTSLETLYCNDNDFTRQIDDSFLRNSTYLRILDASGNNFSSADGLPRHLVELRSLSWLSLSNNPLGGVIPSDMEPNPQVKLISLNNCKLSHNQC